MRDPYGIPKPTSAFLQGNGAPQTEWWNFLNDLQQLFESSDTGLQAQITAIAYVLGSPDGTVANIPPINVGDYLPNTTQIFGEQSVLSVGTLAGGVVRLMLRNDLETPGSTYYYGTDAAGAKGWFLRDLAGLADVDFVTTPPADADVLAYDLASGKWVPAPIDGGGGEGGIGITIGTYMSSAVVLPVATEATSIADSGYDLTGEWYLWCYPSGSIAIDVWSDVFGAIPVVGDSITGGAPPAVIGGTFATGTFPGGPVSIARTDTLLAHINSNTNVKWVKLLLIGDKT